MRAAAFTNTIQMWLRTKQRATRRPAILVVVVAFVALPPQPKLAVIITTTNYLSITRRKAKMTGQLQRKNEFMAESRSSNKQNAAPQVTHRRREIPSSDEYKSLPSLKWREQINNNRMFDKENSLEHTQVKKSSGAERGGLGTELVKLMRKASIEKEAFSGKRKPLGNVSNGSRLLQSKAASKRELNKIQSKVSDAEFC